LGLISFAGFFIALFLPALKTEIVSKKDLILSFPSSFNTMVLTNAFIIEGVLVVLVSRLVQIEYRLSPENILFVASILLGYRRVCLVIFSPVAGWFADRFSFEKVFVFTTLLLTIGIMLISLRMEIIGLFTVFTFGAMNASIASGGAVNKQSGILKDVTDNATWRDIGTASGSLVGALLLSIEHVYPVFIVATMLLMAGIINHQLRLFKRKI
jgi:predicted MFS family arabinose efflux permease